MTLRTLGQSDLKITPIGIGAWAIGGGQWQFAWGPQDDNESVAAIHAGLKTGLRTAPKPCGIHEASSSSEAGSQRRADQIESAAPLAATIAMTR